MDKQSYLQATVVLGKPPSDSMRSWLAKRCAPVKPDFKRNYRLLNRFKLGADPEFVFDIGGERKDASAFNMRPGVFVGADQNGRLAEIRPEPHRSALHVVGSIMASLRLLAPLFPRTLDYNWRAGAWLYDDGIGGHIHFGRKRPTRPMEVAAMDGLAHVLYALRVFPNDQQARRQQGDRYGQVYGQPSDYRLQVHGYEYRSLPSWLDSPWLAYFCVTLAKLAILNPGLVAAWDGLANPSVDNVRYLLANYRGVDDDAALCLYALERHGLPVWHGDDFKNRWGAVNYRTNDYVGINVYPGTVAATDNELQDLYKFFTEKTPIPSRQRVADWEPKVLPAGYEMMTDVVEFRGQVGIGELLGNLVRHAKTVPFTVFPTHNGKAGIYVSERLSRYLVPEWRARLAEVAPGLPVQVVKEDEHYRIGIHKKWRQGKRFLAMKRVLASGIFPVWRIKDIDPTNLNTWKVRLQGKGNTKYRGKRLFPE